MLVDLLNSYNYLMINKDAIQILGLNTAAYCSELLNVYKKAKIKNKLLDCNYFKVDRKYITEQTSLSVEDQLKCDLNLEKVSIIKRDASNPDIIFFDIEVYASCLSSENVQLLEQVSEKVKAKTTKGVKAAAKEHMIVALKESIECKDLDILYALRDWIDAICNSPNKFLNKNQVKIFKDRIDDYCDGNKPLALEIIKVATIHAYVDCDWAINTYVRSKSMKASTTNTQVRNTTQKVTTTVSEVSF